ncbi:uncharacterized protein [Gossypium hirsutum]|uniref:DNA/RNA polymerases superfamily protein n=1 Tax=Gossypium hirsutum TaxID=3635 RepID=A0A1U8IAJ3_GOSHI|nr:uncharacterized protein LOC107894492 [Gossypium hirsutum]
MDFVNGLPLTPTKKDSVWVIVDRLTKTVHFIPVKIDFSLQKLAKLDPRFTSRFWEKLYGALGSRLDFSTAFHPQTDSQSEREVQILEDMLRETEDKVHLIRDRLKAAFDGQKSYADLKRKDIEYFVGDMVFLKVLPWKKVLRSGRKEEIEVRPDLTFKEEPVQILDRNVKVLHKKSIPLMNVLWKNHSTEEATWEPKDSMHQQYPHLF